MRRLGILIILSLFTWFANGHAARNTVYGNCTALSEGINRFDACKEQLCILFRHEVPFVVLPHDAFDSTESQPFPCREYSTLYPGLKGLFFEVVKKIDTIQDALCVYVGENCSFDDLVDFVGDSHKVGSAYRFVVGGLVRFWSHRNPSNTIQSSPWFVDQMVMMHRRNTIAHRIVQIILHLVRAYGYTITTEAITIASFFVLWLTSCFLVRKYGRANLSANRRLVRRSCTQFVLLFLVFIPVCIMLIVLSISMPREKDLPLSDVGTIGLGNFVMVQSTGVEDIITHEYSAPDNDFREIPPPWSRTQSPELMIDMINSDRTKYALSFKSAVSNFHLNGLTVHPLKEKVQGGWYYSTNIPSTLRLNIDNALESIVQSREPENWVEQYRTFLMNTVDVKKDIQYGFLDFLGLLGILGFFFAVCYLLFSECYLDESYSTRTNAENIRNGNTVRRRHPSSIRKTAASPVSRASTSTAPTIDSLPSLFLSTLLSKSAGKTKIFVTKIFDAENAYSCQALFESTISNRYFDSFQMLSEIVRELQQNRFYLRNETFSRNQAFQHVEEMTQSECIAHHKMALHHWRELRESEEFEVLFESHKEAIEVNGDCLMFLWSDFFLAYCEENEWVITLVPGSPAIFLPVSELNLNQLLGEIPTYQVDLLARRLVQLTKATWECDCFARIERSKFETGLMCNFRAEIFDGVEIDLPPATFNTLVGFRVGYLPVDDTSFYNVGIAVANEIVILRRNTETGIAKPEIFNGLGVLEVVPSFTDFFDVSIGGDRHSVRAACGISAIDGIRDSDRTLIEFPPSDDIEPEKARSPELNFERPSLTFKLDGCSKAPLKQVEDDPVYNLAFVPQQKTFNELWTKKYHYTDMKELFIDLKERLKYGDHLSEAICRCAVSNFIGKRKCITLAEAQNLLIKNWAAKTHKNLVLFSLYRPKCRVIRKGWFLMLDNDKLYAVKSSKAVRTSCVVGLVATPVEFGASIYEQDFMKKTPVSNLLDAVEKVSGIQSDFEKVRTDEWYKPKNNKMEQLLGALTLVCTFLGDRVKPEGMFRAAVSDNCLTNEDRLQNVCFNIPVPLGLACSTLSKRSEPCALLKVPLLFREKMVFTFESDVFWDDNHNYTVPLVLGGDERNNILIRALRDSVLDGNEDEHHPRGWVRTILEQLLNKWF